MKTQMYNGKFENVFIDGLLFYHRPDKGSNSSGAYFRYHIGGVDYFYYGQKFKMSVHDKKWYSKIREACAESLKNHVQRVREMGLSNGVIANCKVAALPGYRIRALREYIFENRKIINAASLSLLVNAVGFTLEKEGA